jgi:hypothetical protein
LLAPTGRAAKVIANYSEQTCFWFKKIYFPKKSSGGGVSFTLQQNKHKNTIFIIDEASMISDTNSDSKLYENGSLLDDLISYVYSGTIARWFCWAIQLNYPVNLDISPALDTQTLSLNYNKEVSILSSMKSCVRKKIPEFCTMRPNCGVIERFFYHWFSVWR